MSAETARVLREARKLIERPEAWTQGFFAANARRGMVDATDEDACAWCAWGAVWRVRGESIQLDHPIMRALLLATGQSNHISLWNDAATHAEVLAAFDRAIAAEEARP